MLVLVGLAHTLSLPLWHHHGIPAFGAEEHQRDDLHVCNTGGDNQAPATVCTACLSHRLLNHIQQEQPPELSMPTTGGIVVVDSTPCLLPATAAAVQPRGPPRFV